MHVCLSRNHMTIALVMCFSNGSPPSDLSSTTLQIKDYSLTSTLGEIGRIAQAPAMPGTML